MHTSSSRFSTCRRIVAAFMACIACCVGTPITQTLAVDYTWTSATTGGSWSVTGNWTPTATTGGPTSGDTAALTDASANRTVFYDTAASGTLTGLSFTQTTSGFLNELRVQRNLRVTNALVLGASSGTAQLTLLGTSAADVTGTFSGGITVNSGGVLSLANFNPAGSASIFNSNLTANVTVSGGRLDFSWSLLGTATSSANSTQVLTGNLSMSSGTIAFDNPLGSSPDRRLRITGDVSITGGRLTTTATSGLSNIRFDGASILFAPTSYDSARFQINLQAAGAQTYSGSTPIQTLIARGTGIKTVSNSGTIATLQMIDENGTGRSAPTLKLASNLTVGAGGLGRAGFSDAGSTLDYGVDADIYTLDLTAATGAWTPTTATGTVAQWALTGTAGRIIANGFNLATANVGTTVGPGLILESRAGNNVANNLSLGTSGTGAIDPTSVFRYAGAAAVGTPSTLTSSRAIGILEVTSGALRISSLAGLQNVRVTGGTLDLNNLSLSVTSGSFGGGSVTSGTLTSGTFLATSGTVSASLAGAGGTLTKTASGTFTLSGSNAYDGGTRINGGVLAIDNNFALGTSGSVTFGGGTLQYTANSTLADISPNVLGSGSAISIDTNGQTVTFASALASSNSGGLTKLGSGTLSLSAANAYTGASTVSAGTLLVNNASALGNTANALAVNGGSLNLNGNSVSVGTLSGSSGATISTNSSAGTATLSTTVSGSSTFGGVIQDNGSGRVALTKLGSGTLVLSAVNTYTGTTSVNAGVLQVGVGGGAGRVTGDTVVNTGGSLLLTNVSGTLGNVAVAGGRMDLSTANQNIGALSMTSGTLGLGNTTLRLSVWGNASITGGSVVEPGSAGVINFYGATNVFAPQTLSPGYSFQLIASGNQTFSGSTAQSSLRVRGTGIKTVSNSGTFSDISFVNDAAGSPVTLKLGSNITVGTGGLNLAGFSQQGTALSFGVDADTYTLNLTAAAGAWTPGTGGTGTTALWTLTGTAGRIIANGFNLSSARVDSSVGPGLILESRAGNSVANNLSVGTGSGTISATSVFRYAGTAAVGTPSTLTSSRAIGDLEVTSGALRITSLAGLQNVRVTGGTLDLGNQSLSVTSGSFGGGSVTSGTLTSSTFLATSGTVSASLAGVGGTLTKTTSGTFVLTGANTFTGATDVNAGTLLVNGDQSAAVGAVTVAAGATLGGSGVIGGAVTVNGFFSPGTSPGVLSVAALTLGGASTSVFEIDGLTRATQYDGTDVTGALTYGGSLLIDFGSSITTAFADNTTFNLFDFGSYSGLFTSITTANDGSFYGGLTFASTGAGDKWTATKDSQTLEFTHSTGNLVIVPEPGAIALAAIGIAAAAWARRRRK